MSSLLITYLDGRTLTVQQTPLAEVRLERHYGKPIDECGGREAFYLLALYSAQQFNHEPEDRDYLAFLGLVADVSRVAPGAAEVPTQPAPPSDDS